jgi:DNA polymerase III subunit gamma/tau
MSENYQVTARKWRPMRFDEVVGQDHVTRTLKNAIREGRLAHAYLFTGQRGCGKTTVARLLAKAINCPNAPANGYEPCNKCDVCSSITNGSSMDVAEIDGASNNSVDDIRAMRDNVRYPPIQGKYRVIIIDEVHMLSTSAFNALLKTLEEPPRHLVFIFATTEVQKVLPTILSRTQRYDFRRMQVDEIVTHLRLIAKTDGFDADEEALIAIAKKGDGSMRDAQSIFDQAVAFSGGKLDFEALRQALNLIDADFFFAVTDAIAARDNSKTFGLANDVVMRGYDVEEFIGGLLEHFRALLTTIVTRNVALLEVSKHHADRYLADAKHFSEGDILKLTRIGFKSLADLRNAPSPRMILEMMLVEMALTEKAVDITMLIAELKQLNGGNGSSPIVAATSSVKKNFEPDAKPIAPPPTVPTVAPAAPPNGTPAIVATEDRWQSFKEALTTKSIPFKMISDDIRFLRQDGNTLTIEVSKNHTVDTFARVGHVFEEQLRAVFGPAANYTLHRAEKKLDAPPPLKQEPKPNGAAQEAKLIVGDNVELSPLEVALIRDLGASPVN